MIAEQDGLRTTGDRVRNMLLWLHANKSMEIGENNKYESSAPVAFFLKGCAQSKRAITTLKNYL